MTNHELPTSEWTHSHALEAGDKLETEHGERWEVVDVNYNGSVRALLVGGDEVETWTEEVVRTSLANGDMTRVSDGLSHELATF